ncbi:MAG: glycosyltransferase [Myxococcota bacterium]|nr:glycosyltransferase [Myxococcota bacterium]
MSRTYIVVPCYNEAKRLRGDEFSRFVSEHSDVHFLFVDDGSSDATSSRLAEIATSSPDSFGVITQSSNQGKAEAVRRGLNEAFDRGATYVGYWDADLATPLDEIPRFVETLDAHPGLEMLFGSRVQLLGRTIDRRTRRHYLGRVSATAISLTLGLAVYDTQCGAKLFRVSPESKALFAERFLTNWVFDVEIVARMIESRRGTGRPGPAEVIREIPLWEWRDVEGSKVKPLDFFRSMHELLRIRRRYLRG